MSLAPGAYEAWLPIGVSLLRNQTQATIDLMFMMGEFPLAQTIAALDGVRVNIGDVSYPVRVNVLGDGAWLRQVTRRSPFTPEVLLTKAFAVTRASFTAKPCTMCDMSNEVMYTEVGAGGVSDVSRGDAFQPLIPLPRSRFSGPSRISETLR